MTAETYRKEEPAEQFVNQNASQSVLWKDDVHATGRWGTRSSREVCIVIAVALLMIAATATGVSLAVIKSKNNNISSNSDEPVGATKVDPISGDTVSAYELPVPLPPTIITDQEELDMILLELSNNSVLSGNSAVIPTTVDAVLSAATSSIDPFVLAASWLTGDDTTNALEFTVIRFALAVVYFSTSGSGWTNQTNWLSNEYHCDWHGVICCDDRVGSIMCLPDSFGRVIELNLFKNNLVGPIPTSVVLLQHLQVLYLNENGLTGTLPGAALSTLKNFSKLYAAYNYLTGDIPAEVNAHGMLNTLYLQGNDFAGDFPSPLCPCFDCLDEAFFFGVDCDKVLCAEECCGTGVNCYYLNKTELIAQEKMFL